MALGADAGKAERRVRVGERPGARRQYRPDVDILILALLFVIAVVIYRGGRRGVVLGLWLIAVAATLALFRYHVTSPLDLSF